MSKYGIKPKKYCITLHVDMPQIAADIPITNSSDLHAVFGVGNNPMR